MEAATLTLSSTVQIDPFRLFTCTGHKPTISINTRNRITMTLFPHGHLQVIMCGHKSGHVAHAAVRDDRETNRDDDGKRARGVVGPTVVLACVLGTMCLTLPMCRPSLANAWPSSSAQEETYLPVSTLEALMKMANALTTKDDRLVKAVTKITPKVAQDRLNNATSIDGPVKPRISREELKEAARKLVLSGRTDHTVEKLKRKYKYPVLKPNKTMDEETYNCGLVLVEMLIYQGNYHEAKKLVEELDTVLPTNADHKLYEAVIYLMLGDSKRASKCWDEYRNPTSYIWYSNESSQMKEISENRKSSMQ